MKKTASLLLICLFLLQNLFSQTAEPPFRKEIDGFKRKDSLKMPAKRSILLIGSSSFTKWTDVQDYFPDYPMLNRGFGGSSLPDVIRYVNEIVFPYDPKQVIIYCGENDIAASDTITAQIVLARFKTLFFLIRNKMKNVPIGFVSIKPSPSRWKFEHVFVEANKLIKEFLKKQSRTQFINVHDAMLNADGSVMTDIFIADNLHMNAKGYKIWQPIIQAVLVH
jgi:lysophospholipase L1-like esterase